MRPTGKGIKVTIAPPHPLTGRFAELDGDRLIGARLPRAAQLPVIKLEKAEAG